jgi:inner membrane protein
MATLLIGANLPDADMLSYAWSSVHALWFRRGLTHGLLAIILLPIVLTGCMLTWDRFVRRRPDRGPPVRPRQVLLLASVGVISHPALDFLNVYGMRWLMPLSAEWFYGDTLFIVDPWLWAILTAGIVLASRRRRQGTGATGRPAIAALVVLAAYVAAMGVTNLVGRTIVRGTVETAIGRSPERIMVAPVPVTPFSRFVVAEVDQTYRFGRLRWLPRPTVTLDSLALERFPSHYAATAATRGPAVRMFLSWARFPFYDVVDAGERYLVRIGDARYTLNPEGSWAGVEVEVAKARR